MIDSKLKRLGIIGRPLAHSKSKELFDARIAREEAEGVSFEKFELADLTELPRGLAGFCVTIPYKEEIIPLLDTVSPEAQAIGAVNCVRVVDGEMTGYNTDAHGFRVGLRQLLNGTADHISALVLGNGGAACAVRYVLECEGISYQMVSRQGPLTYADLTPELVAANRLIINTTPLGTWPKTDELPDLPYDAVGPTHFLYDLVYNPPLTAFLSEGLRRGARIINGEPMFRAQADENWRIWNS